MSKRTFAVLLSLLTTGLGAEVMAQACPDAATIPTWSAAGPVEAKHLEGTWWTYGYDSSSSTAQDRSGMRLLPGGAIELVKGTRTGTAATQMGQKPTPTPWVDVPVGKGTWSLHTTLSAAVAAACKALPGYIFLDSSWAAATLSASKPATLLAYDGSATADIKTGPFLALGWTKDSDKVQRAVVAVPYRERYPNGTEKVLLNIPGTSASKTHENWIMSMKLTVTIAGQPAATGATQGQ